MMELMATMMAVAKFMVGKRVVEGDDGGIGGDVGDT